MYYIHVYYIIIIINIIYNVYNILYYKIVYYKCIRFNALIHIYIYIISELKKCLDRMKKIDACQFIFFYL